MDIIKLLKSFVNKEQLNINPSKEDVNLLIEQSLQTLLYPVTNNKEYKKYYVSWVVKQEEFFNIQEDITNIFNKNNIKHLFFKGSIISRLYDDPSVRTRGDIDLYVSYDSFDSAKNLLLSNGYELDFNDCMHHQGFKKNNIEVELHFNMLDTDCDKSWQLLYKNPFELSELESNSLYKMNDTYHLIFCIIHFGQHLRHGAGIRYILDYYYMFNKTNIDFDLLHKLVSELKINKLYSNIINCLRMIFDIDFDNTIKEEKVDFFIEYMLQYGIHGHSNNDTSMNASRHKNKFRYALSRIFLTNKPYRITRYPILGKHWYLYIICLIKHWCYLITHKIGSFFKFLFGKNKNKDLYKKLGI